MQWCEEFTYLTILKAALSTEDMKLAKKSPTNPNITARPVALVRALQVHFKHGIEAIFTCGRPLLAHSQVAMLLNNEYIHKWPNWIEYLALLGVALAKHENDGTIDFLLGCCHELVPSGAEIDINEPMKDLGKT